ncbi:MAG TPA: dihydrofolate reductase family protein [Croceibacterium sp.]|nr:dihydrofolate reductase family protein [Croceibacterium sp.]
MPRRIIGGAFISLDGVMQAPGGPEEDDQGGFEHGGWMAALFEEAIGNQVDTLFSPPFDLLLGRRTYDIFAAHWPYTSIEEDEGIAALFAKNEKFVLTRSEEPLEWQGSHRLADIDAVAALKETDGPDLVIQGSSTLYPQLLQRGLIDRLVLTIGPVVLGSGKRLFGEGTPAGSWKMIEQRLSPNGTVMATYEPAGPIRTVSFGMPDPSPREMERRAKLAAGTW